MTHAVTLFGIAISAPLILLLLIVCACTLCVAIIIVRVGDAYDKACADLIDAHTKQLDEKYTKKESDA